MTSIDIVMVFISFWFCIYPLGLRYVYDNAIDNNSTHASL